MKNVALLPLKSRDDALEVVTALAPTLRKIRGWFITETGCIRIRERPEGRGCPSVYRCPIEAAAHELGGVGLTMFEAAQFFALPSLTAHRVMLAADGEIPNDPVRGALLEACSLLKS